MHIASHRLVNGGDWRSSSTVQRSPLQFEVRGLEFGVLGAKRDASHTRLRSVPLEGPKPFGAQRSPLTCTRRLVAWALEQARSVCCVTVLFRDTLSLVHRPPFNERSLFTHVRRLGLTTSKARELGKVIVRGSDSVGQTDSRTTHIENRKAERLFRLWNSSSRQTLRNEFD